MNIVNDATKLKLEIFSKQKFIVIGHGKLFEQVNMKKNQELKEEGSFFSLELEPNKKLINTGD
jgi:hypothetical protein